MNMTKNAVPLYIKPNCFAPKLRDIGDNPTYSHAVVLHRCNFKCNYCNFTLRNADDYHYYTLDEFKRKIDEMIPAGRNFKFTGGEPTLNPALPEMLRYVRQYDDTTIFLDTNGSTVNNIKRLIDESLIDVLALSLKGLTRDECIQTSGVPNGKLCWDNVFETLDYASGFDNLTIIVTLVFYEHDTFLKLLDFVQLLLPYPNIYIKINNFHPVSTEEAKHLRPMNPALLENYIKELVRLFPELQNRFILEPSYRAVVDYSEIVFL